MERIRHVRKLEYELMVGAGFATYADPGGEVRMSYTKDGVHFSGEDSSFERLYELLSKRPELRVVRDSPNVSLITEEVNYTEKDAGIYARVAQVIGWLGIAPPEMVYDSNENP